jgi:predicted RNase H-like nuclease
MRFLGVDLAWKASNPSGVVVLEGAGFPLRLAEGPATLPTHGGVLDWLSDRLRLQGRGTPTAIGIDAPLLGLDDGRRRPCDDEIARRFGRFAASVHSPSPFLAPLRSFVAELETRWPSADLCPGARATPARPAIREVYPNALQVRLFDLDRPPGRKKHVYKRRKFASKREWVERGLGPFVDKCAAVIATRRHIARDRAWRAFLRERPRGDAPERALKALEDRWDAVLCALAVALEHLERDSMHAYTGCAPDAWRQGYILAPTLGDRASAGLAATRPPPRA